jgi:hypothetical protein
MDLRDEFKKETGLRTIVEDGMGNSFYTEEYVEWLEDRVKKLSISDVMFSFSDMIGFNRWLLQSGEFGNVTRYIYIESKDDFIDDDGSRYTWEDLYNIYQKN